MSVPDKSYSRNTSCTQNSTPAFVLLSLDLYTSVGGLLVPGYHPLDSQCFYTDMVY